MGLGGAPATGRAAVIGWIVFRGAFLALGSALGTKTPGRDIYCAKAATGSSGRADKLLDQAVSSAPKRAGALQK